MELRLGINAGFAGMMIITIEANNNINKNKS